MSDELFIGWRDKAPAADRRFLLGAAAALVAAAAMGGYAQGARSVDPGPGAWDQADIGDHAGVLIRDPYPALLINTDAGVRTVFLASSGKRRVPDRDLAAHFGSAVTVRGSLITRGARAMIAAVDTEDWITPAPAGVTIARAPEIDRGPTTLIGEILDAKCWLGAMRPALGKTHKACAALCAQAGLPLAFCASAACATALDAPLFLDADGRAHDRAVTPLVADLVVASGRMVEVDDVLQFRVARRDIRRL